MVLRIASLSSSGLSFRLISSFSHPLVISVELFGFPYNRSRYISRALISQSFALANKATTSSRSTSSMLWSFAIFEIASLKRVSTLRDQGGLPSGFQDVQGLNTILLNNCISNTKSICLYCKNIA